MKRDTDTGGFIDGKSDSTPFRVKKREVTEYQFLPALHLRKVTEIITRAKWRYHEINVHNDQSSGLKICKNDV
ncbi:MAG: hypothetical protein IPP34_20095 [Bacteroidetes bacterium]|nr:hypothetical protein [Bacteroidota bacterium]